MCADIIWEIYLFESSINTTSSLSEHTYTMRQFVTLIGTGVTLGIVHVLTGPDHLSALATLSANVGNIRQAAWLGIRWGIGHSTGLLLVAIILILVNHPSDEQDTIDVPRKLSVAFECIVGIFMIFLGTYGIHRAFVKRTDSYRGIPSVSHSVQQGHTTFALRHVHTTSPIAVVEVEREGTDIEMPQQNNDSSIAQQSHSRLDSLVGWTRNISTRSMAILAGIVHGLAGPGGVLGVIPAVQLHNGRLAALYLFCFCVTSTITMGVFASIYGSCSSSLTVEQEGRPFLTDCYLPPPRIREFRIEFASASLSILVGILWLILLAIGKLDEIFP